MDDETVAAMLEKLDDRRLERLSFLSEQLHAEQAHFWNRFAALAALHAGLLVVAVEVEGDWARLLVSMIGCTLVFLWVQIQLRSLSYAERWKPLFHLYRRQVGLRWKDERAEDAPAGGPASTTWLASSIPSSLALPWGILLLLPALRLAGQLLGSSR